MRKFLLLSVFLLLTGCDSSTPELHLFGWAEMIDQQTIRRFEQKYQCRVRVDTYDSNETMYAKLRSGGGGYDLIIPTQNYVGIMAQQGLLQEIDQEKLPYLKDLDQSVLTPLSPEILKYSVPFSISYTGLGLRLEKIPDFQNSWEIFQRPNLRKRMTLLNDYREVIGCALITLGYSVNTTSKEEIEKATRLVLEWKKNIAKFENEQYKNGIATGEFLVVQGSSSDILQVVEENPLVSFQIPEEGSVVAYDMFAIPKQAPNPELAYHFLNFLFQPEVAASLMQRTYQLIPNRLAYDHLPEKFRENPGVFPPESVWEKLEPIWDLGENVRLYHEAWDSIKD